jgi:hypothetical protein
MQKEHVTVYRQAGKFAGWPANYGMWAWEDEIVVGFTQCIHQTDAGFHARRNDLPACPLQARSHDGGRTWQTIPTPAPSPGGRGFSADEHMVLDLRVAVAIDSGQEPLPRPCPGGINFTHPNFALMCARTGLGTGTQAWFYISYDRAHTWQGPYTLPMFGQPGIEARTDYLVNSTSDCMLFLTASRENGDEGGGVFLARTTDAGATFEFVSWVTKSPENHLLMPSSVRLDERTLLTSIRCIMGGGHIEAAATWIDLFESTDNGNTWRQSNRPAPASGAVGNPPALILLRDGRLCLTYGYRAAPFGIRARLSEDRGRSWGEVIHLRDDGGCSDLGYPRTIQRSDGTLVTTYYFNEHPARERYIAATLWQP